MAKREDFRLPMARSWQLLLLGVTFGLALALGGPATVSAQEGEMATDCEGNSLAVDTECAFGDGQEFTVAVQLTAALSAGYVGIQVRLRWDDGILDYRPTSDPGQEVVWPDCGVPARTDMREGEPDVDFDTAVLFACVAIPLEPSNYLGPVLLFTFVCIGQGTSPLVLVSLDEAGPLSSYVLDEGNITTETSLEAASVTCGGPAQPRPESEVAVSPPLPLDEIDEPPDEPTLGGPTATSDRAVATPGDGTFVTPEITGDPATLRSGDDDDDDDGGGLPVWAWTLIGLAIAAGVGGGGFVAWRRMQARGEGGEPDQPS